MAKTNHQIVTKVAIAGAAFKAGKAKNSKLKQAAHTGQAPVKDPRSAPPGFAAVPVSTTALPPGSGPPMSSTPASAARSRKGKVTGPIRGFSGGASSGVQKIQAVPSSASSSPPRGRGKRKR